MVQTDLTLLFVVEYNIKMGGAFQQVIEDNGATNPCTFG